MTEAKDKPGDKSSHRLKVVIDPTGRKLLEKLFVSYIQQDKGSFARFPEFMLAADRLVSEFGGKPMKSDDEDDHEPPDEPEEDDDDDLHEEGASEEVEYVKLAIARVLRQ